MCVFLYMYIWKYYNKGGLNMMDRKLVMEELERVNAKNIVIDIIAIAAMTAMT